MLPQVGIVSDIMFAYWLRDNANPRNLRYYITNNIQNEETLKVIARILREKSMQTVPYWPGVELGMWEKEAEVLLGT